MTDRSTAPRTRRSTHLRRGNTKPTRSPTMRLLRAVDDHKPYTRFSREACAAAWQRVQQQVAPRGGKDVEASFYKLVTCFRTGNVLVGVKGDDKYRLLAKLSEDALRCEAVGRTFRRPLDVDVADDVDEHEEPEEAVSALAPAPPRQGSKRRRQAADKCDDGDGVEDAIAARPRRRARTVRASRTVDVDKASDEQFVDLLLEHAPHRAGAVPDATAAWSRVMDALPVTNSLANRAVQGLKARFNCLARAVAPSATRKQREKLTPSLVAKLRAYVELLHAPPPTEEQEAEEEVDVADEHEHDQRTATTLTGPEDVATASQDPPPPQRTAHDTGESDDGAVNVTLAAIALAGHVEKNLHREFETFHAEASQREANWQRRIASVQRLFETRLEIMGKLLKSVGTETKKKTKDKKKEAE